jgi:hypothetical protein
MGNSSSGRWGGKAKCENCPNIDIRRLAREKLLKPANAFVWRWSDGSMVSAKVHDQALELRYATNLKPMQSYWFGVTQTTCNYGGTRSWFICPHCEKQCAKLYERNARFACRICQRLRYQSQALDPLARHQWAYTKLQTRLRDNELKPKGMHWHTYENLVDRLIEIDTQVSTAFNIMAARFMKTTARL